ncbi:MAG: hypothetical protein IPI66_10105 [Chitinophagaceae bacterium]|nr:hypothetical protein [Chitinophagaceae bacterium]
MMYKIFTLAVAVSVIPVSQKIITTDFTVHNTEVVNYIFPYKNTITANPFEPEKKPTEAWSQNWMATAQEKIRQSEYHFTWEEKLNAYCTPNRKNNLRFFYTDKGFTIEPRTTKIPIGEYDPMAMPDEIKYKHLPGWKVKFNLDKSRWARGFGRLRKTKPNMLPKTLLFNISTTMKACGRILLCISLYQKKMN